ncbi:hypothetical protein PHISCL_09530 [Aspergillus sclerotialis]|uniref:Uncharacterized protein n=1 Tax=Aspergillus sclerotialis TaxID=2070753 RepID=A0A3A2Z508_9EURO|nr:hypothetical protein PHISCL_09530 [Aspergillus sclerotialis]
MGVQHNVMNLFKEQGMSQQAGYDKIDALLRERVRDWYIALSQIPAINEQTDIETQKYIRGCEEVIVAALNWSFKANRYFGVHAAKVRETREVDII